MFKVSKVYFRRKVKYWMKLNFDFFFYKTNKVTRILLRIVDTTEN